MPATVGKSLTMSVTVGESLCQSLWERVYVSDCGTKSDSVIKYLALLCSGSPSRRLKTERYPSTVVLTWLDIYSHVRMDNNALVHDRTAEWGVGLSVTGLKTQTA